MTLPKAILVSVVPLALCVYRHAAAEPVSCPDTITVNQQLATQPSGWRAVLDETPHRLISITFFDGPPEELASLVNDRTAKLPGKETAIWRFHPTGEKLNWLSCGYAGTAITLTKSLPARTASCAVTYNLRQRIGGMPMIESMTCK